jgi:hypothetical protein
MAAGDCPSPRAKRQELPCEEGEVGAEGWPRAHERARTGPAAAAVPCHAGRPAHCMRPGGLIGQARRQAGGALFSVAEVLFITAGLLQR